MAKSWKHGKNITRLSHPQPKIRVMGDNLNNVYYGLLLITKLIKGRFETFLVDKQKIVKNMFVRFHNVLIQKCSYKKCFI